MNGSRARTVFAAATMAVLSFSCSGSIMPESTGEGAPVPAPGGTPVDPARPPSGATGGSSGMAMAPQPPPPPAVAGCAVPRPGPAPLRRLTAREYDNTVRDLVGLRSVLSLEFSGHAAKGFENDVTALAVDRVLAQAFMDTAAELAAELVKDLPATLKCNPASAGEDACARGFFESFGARAWRRPVEAAELSFLDTHYRKLKGQYGFSDAIRLIVQYFLQSPRFLYRPELGVVAAGGDQAVRLTPWETASRLSYFLWGTMPDAALFQAAKEGKLATKAEVAAQAQRMLMDPRAREIVAYFNAQWLQLAELDTLDRSKTTFPKYATTLNPLYRAEVERYVDDVLWQGKGDLATLLTASHSFVNDTLAAFYGLTGTFGPEWKRVDLDPSQRSGLLTRGGLLALLAHRKSTSPVKRGMFVRTEILCAPPPPPPPEVDTTISEQDQTKPARVQLLSHQKDPQCAACHRLIDPIGFGFENYDAVGLWRTTEAGAPVDAGGELIGGELDVTGRFVGASELGRKLAESTLASDCVAKHWFRFAFGRADTDADACTLSALKQAFASSGKNVRQLLVTLVQTDGFLFKPVGGTP